MAKIILFNKPFNVLSQFTDAAGRQTLSRYIHQQDVYVAGRLDRDSEGLLLLTSDGRMQHLISHPKHKMDKTYWVQVEGEIDAKACHALMHGVVLKDGSAKAKLAQPMEAPDIWPRVPAIRERKTIATTWLKIVINEGRHRQVRRMTAAVGFPTLRLIRFAIGEWTIASIPLGQWTEQAIPATFENELKSPKWRHKKKTKKSLSKRTRS